MAASASPGDGTAVACPNPHGGQCFGAVAPGTYSTSVFEPAVTYPVPDGWYNGEDLPGNFWLYREVDDQGGALGGSYIGICQDALAAAKNCAEENQPDVGTSAEEMMAWATELPSVSATTPKPISIGGLDGTLHRPLHRG